MIELDKQLFLFLNGLRSPFWDQVMWYVSETWIWVPLYLLFIYLIWKKYRGLIWVPLLAAALLITLSDQVHLHLFKNIFERLRPSHEPSLEGMVHTVRNYAGGQYGFVSGHATNSFAIATFVIAVIGKHYKYLTPLVLLWAVLVAYSRIYMGVHYPGDILGGMILGSAFGLGIGYACRKLLEQRVQIKDE